jgi:hypothetical protein
MYYFQIWDWFSAAFSVLLIAALESIVVAWLYGKKNKCMNDNIWIRITSIREQ